MPLTPADVHNVAFSKPPIGKRGYNEDEVDAFLDLVEQELSRLIEDNADLRQRVGELDQELADAKSNSSRQQRAPAAQQPPQPAPEPVVQRPVEPPKPAPVVAAPVAPVAAQPMVATPICRPRRFSASLRRWRIASPTTRRASPSSCSAVRAPTPSVSWAMPAAAPMRWWPRPGRSPKRCCPTLRRAPRLSCVRPRRRRTHSRLMPSASTPRSWQPSTSSGRSSRTGSSSLKTFEREYRVRLKSYLESQLARAGATFVGSSGGQRPGRFRQGHGSAEQRLRPVLRQGQQLTSREEPDTADRTAPCWFRPSALAGVGFALLVLALTTGSVVWAWSCIVVCLVGAVLLLVGVLSGRRSKDDDSDSDWSTDDSTRQGQHRQ